MVYFYFEIKKATAAYLPLPLIVVKEVHK